MPRERMMPRDLPGSRHFEALRRAFMGF